MAAPDARSDPNCLWFSVINKPGIRCFMRLPYAVCSWPEDLNCEVDCIVGLHRSISDYIETPEEPGVTFVMYWALIVTILENLPLPSRGSITIHSGGGSDLSF